MSVYAFVCTNMLAGLCVGFSCTDTFPRALGLFRQSYYLDRHKDFGDITLLMLSRAGIQLPSVNRNLVAKR